MKGAISKALFLFLISTSICRIDARSLRAFEPKKMDDGSMNIPSQRQERVLGVPKGAIPLLSSSLTIWKANENNGSLHQVCRIKGVCRVGDGSILLPLWMKAHSTEIEMCGLKEVSYAIHESKDQNGNEAFTLEGIISTRLELKDNYREFDIVGGDPPRGERHLLAHDMAPTILMLDMIKRPEKYETIFKPSCLSKGKDECRDERNSSSFKPLLLVDARISDTLDYKWPKSLIRLMRNTFKGILPIVDLQDIYGWRVRSQASCFQSIVSTNIRTGEMSAETFLEDHEFFSSNGLKRTPAEQGQSSDRPCTIKVLILNRYGKRFIEGSDNLNTAISYYGREVSKKEKRVLVESEVVFFENSSFHEQVSVMQEANIVVTSHGDVNANLMFLRPKAAVFEILPFGFGSNIYRNLTVAYGAHYENVTAQPDTEVFTACVEHFNVQHSKQKSDFLQEWRAQATNFVQSTIRKKANIASGFVVPDDDDESKNREVKRLRQCASYQRISVDIKHLARKVVETAARQCQVKDDLKLLDS